jgi:hypothetical protein
VSPEVPARRDRDVDGIEAGREHWERLAVVGGRRLLDFPGLGRLADLPDERGTHAAILSHARR